MHEDEPVSVAYPPLQASVNDLYFPRGSAMPPFKCKDYERGAMIRKLAIALILANLPALSIASAQVASSQSPAPGFVYTLMPQPSQLSTQEGRLVITPSL